jgi:hypothetical protein
MPHQSSDAAIPPELPHSQIDCPILIATVVDPLLGSFKPEMQLCMPDHYADYMWPLSTILSPLIIYTAIRGIERFNDRNARISAATGVEDYEMMELRSKR